MICYFINSESYNINYQNYCGDYTPDPIGSQYTYTMFPFWTDLIAGNANQTTTGNASKMLFKAFDDYVVFGWYHMREYYRNSSNSFEAILYENDSYEYRYRELDIIQHDVLIGEQNTSSDHSTYRFYDKSNAYPTWDSWDATFTNQIENGGVYSASFASKPIFLAILFIAITSITDEVSPVVIKL